MVGRRTFVRILITGSSGLIGSAMARVLSQYGHHIRPFDIRRRRFEDVRNTKALREACHDVDGILHFAAVSRVVWAQRDPALCTAVNEGGLGNLCDALRSAGRVPWLIFASSREVYGQQSVLPVHESAELRPCNIYARSKLAGEELVLGLREHGFVTAVVRFSNVYGSVYDYPDRVVPAFARAAVAGGVLRVEGTANMLDFTYIADVTSGVLKLVERVSAGDQLPPIHFTTGRGVTLGELAFLAQAQAQRSLEMQPHSPRDYDVSRFCGTTVRARELLDWVPRTSIEDGFAVLVRAYQQGPEQL